MVSSANCAAAFEANSTVVKNALERVIEYFMIIFIKDRKRGIKCQKIVVNAESIRL